VVIEARLARARAVAAAVPDPEIPALTLEELGLLVDVALANETVEVTITPSYLGCPANTLIAQEIVAALARAGFADARVRTVLSPAWTTDRITAEGKRKLQQHGIAPPDRMRTKPACPRCGNVETEELSAFGATPCTALFRCLACREPFAAFKCH